MNISRTLCSFAKWTSCSMLDGHDLHWCSKRCCWLSRRRVAMDDYVNNCLFLQCFCRRCIWRSQRGISVGRLPLCIVARLLSRRVHQQPLRAPSRFRAARRDAAAGPAPGPRAARGELCHLR